MRIFTRPFLERCVNGRKVLGGPAPENVRAESERVLALLSSCAEQEQQTAVPGGSCGSKRFL